MRRLRKDEQVEYWSNWVFAYSSGNRRRLPAIRVISKSNGPDQRQFFVEVKGPDWQSELAPAELRGTRKTQGKWVDLEGRAVGITTSPFDVIRRNAIKKFTPTRSNLIVIVDDLFVSPAQARGVVEGGVEEFFREPDVDVIGGILFVKADYFEGRIDYFINFYENPVSLETCRLPSNAVQKLVEISELQRADRDGRYPSPLAGLLNEAQTIDS